MGEKISRVRPHIRRKPSKARPKRGESFLKKTVKKDFERLSRKFT